MALSQDAIHSSVNHLLSRYPDLRVEIEQIGEATYYGFAKTQSASTANPVWLIARVIISGAVSQVIWASQKFDQILNNKVSLFSNPPFDNQNAIKFGAVDSNDKIFLANHASINFANNSPFSVSCWFRSNSGATQVIIGKQGSGNNPGWRVQLASGRFEFHMAGDGILNDRMELRSPANTYDDDNWHHAVVVKPNNTNASNVIMVIDGVQVTPTVQLNNLTGVTTNTVVGQISGRNAGNTNTYVGFLDEISIFNVALSVANAQALFNLGSPNNLSTHPNAANLIAWWRMGDNDTFPTLTNLGTVGTALNGTMTEMKASDIVGETAHVP